MNHAMVEVTARELIELHGSPAQAVREAAVTYEKAPTSSREFWAAVLRTLRVIQAEQQRERA